MRALIRIDLLDAANILPPREEREEYDKKIRELFSQIGFNARELKDTVSIPSQAELAICPDVEYIFHGVPEVVSEEEKKHLIMLGYTSDGQAKFVICSINQNVLHIRVRDDLFEKLRRSCREMCTSIWTYMVGLHWWGKHVRLKVREYIEVMEPGHHHPTIIGYVIHRPLKALLKQHPGESIMAFSTGLAALALFLFSPELAKPLAAFLEHIKHFEVAYIQGALERVYSAFLVTCTVTIIDLVVRYRALKYGLPILWNAGIEPTQDRVTKQ